MFRKHLLPFLPIVLFPLLLLGTPILQGQALFWGTPSLQFIPWAKFAWDSVLQGHLPLWNSFNGMGAPFIANYQTAFFYPPTWITFFFYLLGGTSLMAWSFTLVIYLHLVWAGLGTAFLMRKLGFNGFSQAVSGVTFSLCGYLVARVAFFPIIWAVAWFPWLIVATELVLASLQQNKQHLLRNCLLLILFCAMQLLAGHAQTTWYSLLFTAAWVIFRGFSTANWKTTFQALGLLIGCVVVAAMVSAVQLLPTAEYLLQSQRVSDVGYAAATTYSFWPWRSDIAESELFWKSGGRYFLGVWQLLGRCRLRGLAATFSGSIDAATDEESLYCKGKRWQSTGDLSLDCRPGGFCAGAGEEPAGIPVLVPVRAHV